MNIKLQYKRKYWYWHLAKHKAKVHAYIGRLNIGDLINCIYTHTNFNECVLALGMETQVFDS